MAHSRILTGIFAVLAVLIIYSLLPIGTAFEFGHDEGFGLMRAFLFNKGYKLYEQIWSDQPPLYTVVIATAFRMFGTSILTGRLIAVGFGLLLLAVFYELVRTRSGPWTALIAIFFLLSSPNVLLLTTSVMLEVPTFAVALLASLLLFRYLNKRKKVWALASGATMGFALQIKFAAILIVPAMMLELLLLHRCSPNSVPSGTALKEAKLVRRQVNTPQLGAQPPTGAIHCQPCTKPLMEFFFWLSAVVIVVLSIATIWERNALVELWKPHTVGVYVPGFGEPGDFKFDPGLLWRNIECVVGAAVSVVWALFRRRVREIVFPIVLLLTAAAVHAVHRPWWNYYYLHFAIPLAWLASWAIFEGIKKVYALISVKPPNGRTHSFWQPLATGALVALVLARSERNLEGTVKGLRQVPRVDANPIVTNMLSYGERVRWVYARAPIYAFHAKLAIPPELAVVTPKRFWSGQITREQIISICSRYEPELLILPETAKNGEWAPLLSRKYHEAVHDNRNTLYIANDFQ